MLRIQNQSVALAGLGSLGPSMWYVAVRQPAVFCLSHLFKDEVFSGAPLPIVVIRSKHPFAESHDGFMLAKVMGASSRMGLNSSGELFAPKEKAVLLSDRMSACPKRLDGWASCICCQAYHINLLFLFQYVLYAFQFSTGY